MAKNHTFWPLNSQVRDKACNKIANLLASRDLMDTPLDKVGGDPVFLEISAFFFSMGT